MTGVSQTTWHRTNGWMSIPPRPAAPGLYPRSKSFIMAALLTIAPDGGVPADKQPWASPHFSPGGGG